jgi:hypothetical protein
VVNTSAVAPYSQSAVELLVRIAYLPKHIERDTRIPSLFFLDRRVEITSGTGLQLVMKRRLDIAVADRVADDPADPAAVLPAVYAVIHRHFGYRALPAFAVAPAFVLPAILEFPAVLFFSYLPFVL